MKTNGVITKKVNLFQSKNQVSDHTTNIIRNNSMEALILHQNEAVLAQMRVDFRGEIVPFPQKRVNIHKMSA